MGPVELTGKILKEQYSHVCPHCGGFRAAASPDLKGISQEFDRLAMQVRNGEISADDMPVLLSDAIAEELLKGVEPSLADIADDGTAWMLRNNIYSFSGAKSFQELQELSAVVMDGDKIRSLADFKRKARAINQEYNLNYLNTEYNFAIASAQNSARWWEYQENADIMPMLKYQTVGDSRVRDDHRKLDGIVRRHDHSFWNIYYPPNGWGCRCEAIQLSDANADESGAAPDIKLPAMFKTNLAQTGVIFPDDSAYYKGITDDAVLMMRPAWQKVFSTLGNKTKRGLTTTDIVSANVLSQTDSALLSQAVKTGFSNRFVNSYTRAVSNALRKSAKYEGQAYAVSGINQELSIGMTIKTDAYIVAAPAAVDAETVYQITSKSGADISDIAVADTKSTVIFKPGIKLIVDTITRQGDKQLIKLREI